jgi:hypothetical protein
MTVSEELAIYVAIREAVEETIAELGIEAVYALSMFPSAEKNDEALALAA